MNPLINSQQVKIYGLVSFSRGTSVFVTSEDMDKPFLQISFVGVWNVSEVFCLM